MTLTKGRIGAHVLANALAECVANETRDAGADLPEGTVTIVVSRTLMSEIIDTLREVQ